MSLHYGQPRSSAVGVQETRNPLPPGVYYVDVFEFDIPKFNAWKKGVGNAVEIIRSALHTDESPDREWVLFEVKEPVIWFRVVFGFPTVAPKGRETQEADTVQRPPPELDPLDALDLGKIFGSAGIAALLMLGLVWLASKSDR